MHAMDHQEARGLLEELTEIKSATRATLHAYSWQWLVVWSLIFLGAGVMALVPAWEHLGGSYWAVAVPLGVLATAVISVKIEARSPVRQRPIPYWMVGGAITIATGLASILLPDTAIVVVIWVILGLGFAFFAWLEKVTPAAWLLAGMSVGSALLGLVVDDTFDLYPALALSFSAVLAGIITGMRIQSKR